MSDSEEIIIEVIQDFAYAYRGCDVVEYKQGATVSVAKEVAELALGQKWAKRPASAKPAGKAKEKQGPVAISDSAAGGNSAGTAAAETPPEAAAESGEPSGQ